MGPDEVRAVRETNTAFMKRLGSLETEEKIVTVGREIEALEAEEAGHESMGSPPATLESYCCFLRT
jgi:hypothetical protein